MKYTVTQDALNNATKLIKTDGILLKRFSPLDGIGADLRGVTDYEAAMQVSKIGFIPEEKKLLTADGKNVPTHKAIFNGDELVSVVKKNYNTIPNMEAFEVAEDLVNSNGFNYEVGSVQGAGKVSRLALAGETMNILGDDFIPYAVITNSFDCSTGLSFKFMLLRVVCLNGMVREWKNASSSIWLSHTTTKENRLNQLGNAVNKAMEVKALMQKEADVLSNTPFTRDEFTKEIIPQIISKVYPQRKLNNITEGRGENINKLIATTLAAYDADDTQNFNNTAYKVLLTMADLDSHLSTKNQDPNVYLNRILQNGLINTSLVNLVGNYLLSSRGIKL